MKIKTIGELKKYLSEFPDDMEVKMYNGMVDDWMDITISESTLAKEDPKFMLHLINLQRIEQNKPQLTTANAIKSEWKFINDVAIDEIGENNLKYKQIQLIQGISRRKKVSDRVGNIEY